MVGKERKGKVRSDCVFRQKKNVSKRSQIIHIRREKRRCEESLRRLQSNETRQLVECCCLKGNKNESFW
jgi:hypothetical protein